jgi:hypothetical protein
MTGSQIWLSSLLDDHHQSTYVTALGEKKAKKKEKRKKPESHLLI